MDSSYNFDENSIRPLIGRAVCVILEDGTRHTGILTSCGPNALVLNGERTGRPVDRKRKSKLQAEISTLPEEDPPADSAYWGKLGFGPAMDVSMVKAVIPMYPIRDVIPI